VDLAELCDTVADAAAVVAVGARTQWEVGGSLDGAPVEVVAPGGVVAYEPDDLTITVGAGLSFADLDAVLREHGQECALDPRDGAATIGGVLACGLSGPRRLRHGPVRDHVLEVRFVTADGRLVKGGGPTVKNVTGYDLPRLLVGSLGTLGVLAQVTLRCRPRPQAARWIAWSTGDPAPYRPSSWLWDGETHAVLVEGVAADVTAQTDGRPGCEPPAFPAGPHRGRISVAPARLDAAGAALAEVDGLRWLAEVGVGTVHVATDDAVELQRARAVAHDHDGWMLREAGGEPGDDGFGRALPNAAVMRRIKEAFDPTAKLGRGRLPL
jgi:glycolate oxidase FAD binding subunit